MNQVEIKKFLGIADVRIVNNEWIVLKDMFAALGRVKSDGTWTDEKNKLEKIIGKENLKKFSLEINSTYLKTKARKTQYFVCAKLCEIEKIDIIGIFGKGKNRVTYTNYRKEHNFIENIKDFFKYDKYISLESQFKIMEFRVDLMIGCLCCVEFDENYHKYQKQDDIDRMKKIALALTYDGTHLHVTNNYRKVSIITLEKNNDFTVYDIHGILFVRVRNRNCMNWIPIVYGFYSEWMDAMGMLPKNYFNGNSNELSTLRFSC